MRILATALAYVATLVAVAVVAFFVVIALAGPHADLLPSWLQAVVRGLGLLAVLMLPIWAARATWRRV